MLLHVACCFSYRAASDDLLLRIEGFVPGTSKEKRSCGTGAIEGQIADEAPDPGDACPREEENAWHRHSGLNPGVGGQATLFG